MQVHRTRTLLLLSTLILATVTGPGFAGTITVIADVNAHDDNTNNPFYFNVLGSSTNVLFAGGATLPHAFWGNLPGVTVAVSSATLTTSLLSPFDLVVINADFGRLPFNVPFSYSSGEMEAVADFLASGGDVLMVAEAGGVDVLATYNAFLSGIGSSIRYDFTRHQQAPVNPMITPHPFSAGISTFQYSAANGLTGGTALVSDEISGQPGSSFALVATESFTAVPEPGSLTLLGLGLLGLGCVKQRRT